MYLPCCVPDQAWLSVTMKCAREILQRALPRTPRLHR
jgi:hypothetical protein